MLSHSSLKTQLNIVFAVTCLLVAASKASDAGNKVTSTPEPTKPWFAKDSDKFHISASCAGGTNSGLGVRKLDLKGFVDTKSVEPVAVELTMVWVAWNGGQLVASKPTKQTVTCSKNKGGLFSFSETWERNDGATKGVFKPGLGVYRGWAIKGRDPQGKEVVAASNSSECRGFAP